MALFSRSFVDIATDHLFSSLGYAQVFVKIWETRLLLAFLAAMLFFAAVRINLIASR